MNGCDPQLSGLVGNHALKKQLIAQLGGRGLSHAYLISGPKGSGKKTLARLLAAAYVCTDQTARPCGQCPACRKSQGGVDPDVITVETETRDITVDIIRQLRSDAYIRPNAAPRKVYIIPEAQRMNDSAQNAMLKLLEEGPAYAAFLLLVENPASILSTIRSRCEGLALTPVSVPEAETVLTRLFPALDAGQIRTAAANCGGIIGNAVRVLEGEDNPEINDTARKLVQLLAARQELEMARLCVGLEKWERSALTELFARTALLLRHGLALQSGADHTVEAESWEDAALLSRLPARVLLNAAALMDKLRTAADSNVGVGHLCGSLCAGLNRRTGS